MDNTIVNLEAMDSDGMTDVMSNNPVLTLITTDDIIPTSGEVTVLTTALGDVPLMTATLGTLADVPLVSSHPTFVTTHPGVSTVYATAIAPSHRITPQTVLVRDGGTIAVMNADGVQQTIVVHSNPRQLTVAEALGTSHDQTQTHGIVNVNLQTGECTPSLVDSHMRVMITDNEHIQLANLDHEHTIVEQSINEIQTQSDPTLSELAIDKTLDSVPEAQDMQVDILAEEIEVEDMQKDSENINSADLFEKNVEQLEDHMVIEPILTDVVEPPSVPIIPTEVVCTVCYQAFLNPRCKKLVDELNSIESNAIEDSSEADSNLQKPILEDNFYGRSLDSFFELTRINMSIVTRRSFKDYAVPICHGCNAKVSEIKNVMDEIKKLEKHLLFLRHGIKEEIISSNLFYKNAENIALAENRKTTPGLMEILTVIDRIREDILNDGRPPRVPRKRAGGRKPKKQVVEPVETPVEASLADRHEPIAPIPQLVLISDLVTNPTENNVTDVAAISLGDSPLESETLKNENDQPNIFDEDSSALDDSKTIKSSMRTSFGRLIKRPSYMINDLTDDLSDLADSEDEPETIELKPEILQEETMNVAEDFDDEDPAWSPGHGVYISDKILATSSDDTDEASDEDSDIGSPSAKMKFKREPKEKKTRKPKPYQRKQFVRKTAVKPENINYEVKVIQLDGTELMTINTTGAEGNIGLEPDITQKVMDSQAVIMVKNQLFGKRVQCPHCPRTFTDPNRKDVHVKKKHEGISKPFECGVCEKRFGRQDHMRNHMKRHTRPTKDKSSRSRPQSQKNHSCDFCGLRFRNKSELKIHTRSHTGEKPFKCEYCSVAFISALKREFHVEQAHPEIPPLRCEHCKKGFFRQHRLRIHTVSHSGEKTNICEICGKSFSQAAMLRYHQTTHTELNLKQFKCQECNRVFANPQNLKSHVESQHEKKYKHTCDTCGRGYTQMSHLRRHLRTHSGEQPYICNYCPKKFTSGAALKIHARIHTGERPYWCCQCEKGFRSKTKLGRHLKTLIHSGAKDLIKKEATETAELETEVTTATTTHTWTEIVGIITGV